VEVFTLSDQEHQLIQRLVHDQFGINLGEQKRPLIIERLQGVLRSGGFSSFKEYYHHVVSDPTGQALLTLVDKVSTNHTFFFREKDHFDFFKTVFLEQITKTLEKKGTRSIRIWCAGCSSGEEPYTLAMIISEYFGYRRKGMDIGILATDISVSVLEKAMAGIYPEGQVFQIPPSLRQRYFRPLKDGDWEVKENLKEMVVFRRLNLMRQNYPFKGLFQCIFCRNVMIYFDDVTRRDLVDRFHRYFEPSGYLFIGHSESIDRSTGKYRFIQPAIYEKV